MERAKKKEEKKIRTTTDSLWNRLVSMVRLPAMTKLFVYSALFITILLLNLAVALAQVQSHRLSEIRTIDTNLDLNIYQLNASYVNGTYGDFTGNVTVDHSLFVDGGPLNYLGAYDFSLSVGDGTTDIGALFNSSVVGIWAMANKSGVESNGGWAVRGDIVNETGGAPISATLAGYDDNENYWYGGYFKNDIGTGEIDVLIANETQGVYVHSDVADSYGGYFSTVGSDSYGIYAEGTAYAGQFSGNVSSDTDFCIDGGNCLSALPPGTIGNVSGAGATDHVAVWQDNDEITYDQNQLYWDSTNDRLGIGTATPDQRLKVDGDANITGTVYASNVSSNSPLQLQVKGFTLMYFNDTSGNIGVGLNNNAPRSRFAVGGAGVTSSGIYGSGADYGIVANVSKVGGTGLYATTANGGYPGIFMGGNVGIGTTSPDVPLDVELSSGGAAEIGHSSNSAIGDFSVAMGESTTAQGHASTALGYYTNASNSFSTAIGYGAEAIGGYSVAIGHSLVSEGESSIAMGKNTNASGYASAAMGYNTTTSGFGSVATGVSTISGGYGSISSGYSTNASGDYSSAQNFDTVADGAGSTAMGYKTLANGSWSLATGYDTVASGLTSTAIGRSIQVYGQDSVGIGLDGTTTSVTADNVMSIMGGNVGIGTTSPGSELEVEGNATVTDSLFVQGGLLDYSSYTMALSAGNGSKSIGGYFNASSFGVLGTVDMTNAESMEGGGVIAMNMLAETAGQVEGTLAKYSNNFGWVAAFARHERSDTDVRAFLANETVAVFGRQGGGDYAGLFEGEVRVAGNITPSANDTYTLGTPDLVWQDVYVGPTSLHVGGVNLSNVNGELSWDGEKVSGLWSSVGTKTSYVYSAGPVGINGEPPLNYHLAVNGAVCDGTGTVTACSSDARLKENITELDDAVGTLMELKPVEFNWKDTGERSMGLIAQDIEQAYPEWVVEKPDGFKTYDDPGFKYLLIKAVQELKAENTALKELVCLDHPDADICNE